LFLDCSIGLGAFATTMIPKGSFLEDFFGTYAEGTTEYLLKFPFTFLFNGERKPHSIRKAINAYSTAKEGHCLSAYANYVGTNLYYFHGGSVSNGHSLANVEFIDEFNQLRVRATKTLAVGDEIIFPLGEYKDTIPNKCEAVSNWNMREIQFKVYQPFSPVQVGYVLQHQLTKDDIHHCLKYLQCLKKKVLAGKETEIAITRFNIDISVGNMLRC